MPLASPRLPRVGARLRAMLAALPLIPGQPASGVPDETATTLKVPVYAALTTDVNGDGTGDLVVVVSTRNDPAHLSIVCLAVADQPGNPAILGVRGLLAQAQTIGEGPPFRLPISGPSRRRGRQLRGVRPGRAGSAPGSRDRHDPFGHLASTTISVVAPLDYRRLPWVPIVALLTLGGAAFLFLRAPSSRRRRLPATVEEGIVEEGVVEEIELD